MRLTLDQQIKWLFRINAIINWALSIRGILDPSGMAVMFGGPVPNYPFTIRLWSGLIFMFGIMFWETSNELRGKLALIKYNWIEKTITAGAVTLGFIAGDVSTRLMILVIFTNWLWIPLLIYYEVRLRRNMAPHSNAEESIDPVSGRHGATHPSAQAIAK